MAKSMLQLVGWWSRALALYNPSSLCVLVAAVLLTGAVKTL